MTQIDLQYEQETTQKEKDAYAAVFLWLKEKWRKFQWNSLLFLDDVFS